MINGQHTPPVIEHINFADELKWIVERSKLTYRQIAGNSYSQLSRAIAKESVPDRDTVLAWCFSLYEQEAITEQEARRLINLAGYATPDQQREALRDTTEQRAIKRIVPDTQPLPRYKSNSG